MSKVRVLVGTRKGAFILTADGKREQWEVSGPHFAGWETLPPERLAGRSQSHLRLADQRMVRTDSSSAPTTAAKPGISPERRPESRPRPVRRKPPATNSSTTLSEKTGKPLTTHQFYDGTQHPWEFKRVWHLEPSLTDPDTVYAGVEDAALFRSTDGGENWHELSGLRGHGTGPNWQPGAGGMCLHTIILDPSDPKRIFIAISAAGAFRTDDGGAIVEADQQRPALAIHSRPDGRSRPLRAPRRHESEAARRALHAEALGRDALRRRRRQLARSQRQPAHRLRLRHRRARARTGDHLRRPHQERRRTLRARTANCASTAAAPAATSGNR